MARSRAGTGSPPPLTAQDVADLESRLADGGRPRVELRLGSAGLPAGTRATVSRVDDPERNRECVIVRLGGDDIPFAPEELALARRGRPPAAPEPAAKPARRVGSGTTTRTAA